MKQLAKNKTIKWPEVKFFYFLLLKESNCQKTLILRTLQSKVNTTNTTNTTLENYIYTLKNKQ